MLKTAIASCAVHLVPLVLYLISVALMALWPIRSLPTYQVGPRNLRNPLSTKDLRLCNGFYNCRETITDVVSALQIHLFVQNKANFSKSQINVSTVITMNYEQRTMNDEIKNKPNTKPIQSQFKPNTKPIRTQFKPKQSQFQGGACALIG